MIQTSDNNIWLEDSVHHDLLITDGTVTVSGTSYSVNGATVTIMNDLIEFETFKLSQSLCSEPLLHFGACEANGIEFTIHQNLSGLKNKVVKAYIIPDYDASKMVQIGVFKIYEDTLSSDKTKRAIVAYDKLYEILNADVTAWYNTALPNANSSMTLADFRASFLSHFNVTAESTTLINDSAVIKRTIDPEKISGADVIKAICELNGVFGKITNEGKFRFVELLSNIDSALYPRIDLYPMNSLYPQDFQSSVGYISKSYYIDVDFEDWKSEDITQLSIRTNDSDIGATVGTAGNLYVIENNFLTYGYDTTTLTSIATNILSKMVNRHYTPCTVKAIGNPCYEVGDPVRINTKWGNVFTYILERELTGLQALRDLYESQGEKEYDTQLNSAQSQLRQKVTRDEIVIDLDGQMSNNITIKKDSITFHSDGALVVDTTNFKLDEQGNAEFSGNISGALINGSTGLLAKTEYNYALMGTSGFSTGVVSGDTLNPRVEITGDVLVFTDPQGQVVPGTYLKYNEMLLHGSLTCDSIVCYGTILSGGWQVVTYGQVTTKTKANLGDNDLILVLNSNS